ncbi:MAG: SDR family oxidoreductase [Pseudomonadota bacterium]|nr:SDR family oxidoreductase [Pseudomonadota bacterium]
MTAIADKTIFISGGARGIGLAVALRLARDGARLVITSRSDTESAVAAIEEAGGRALGLTLDMDDPQQIDRAVAQTADHFGGIDALVHNASQIHLGPLERISSRALEVMLAVNTHGPLHLTRAALPHLRRATNPHIVAMAPPVNMSRRWFTGRTPYAITKLSLSMMVMGLAEEFRRYGIAVNAVWPLTVIDTAALKHAQHVKAENCRKPEIVADALHVLLTRPARISTGRFFLDEELLREYGVSDFRKYAVSPGKPLMSDLFTD